MVNESTIRAYQKVLLAHQFPTDCETFSEAFAIARFQKKFQEPDPSADLVLKQKCWDDWLAFDQKLGLHPTRGQFLSQEWYAARVSLHKALSGFLLGDFRLPRGSEFFSTRGLNSLQQRLENSEWACTKMCFRDYADIMYNVHAFRRATKERYRLWFQKTFPDDSAKRADQYLWRMLKDPKKIFSWKLSRVTTFIEGSRFATVPKNNSTRRPINIEGFGNLLVQSSMGNGIRSVLERAYGADLDRLQEQHRIRISDLSYATIDLKNASDSVSTDLCNFLFPRAFMDRLERARSPFILGPDGSYHQTRKLSSMGNGFTFEVMTLILTAICRQLDPKSSVYGDDIIIKADKAKRLISLLNEVGFVVNHDKSFIDGPFRESCGANFHQVEGYVDSFDFHWPTNLMDCALILAKCHLLRKYSSFEQLRVKLVRATPPSLHGGMLADKLIVTMVESFRSVPAQLQPSVVTLPAMFITPRGGSQNWDPHLQAFYRRVPLLRVVPREKTPCHHHLKASQWAKYFMYLHAGRRSKDVVEGQNRITVSPGRLYCHGITMTRL